MSASPVPAAAAAASVPAARKRVRSRRSVVKGNRLVLGSFARGLKAVCDNQVYQRGILRRMKRVASSCNKKMDHVLRGLAPQLLRTSQMLLGHGKKEGLEIAQVRDSLRLFLLHDPLDLVEDAHAFGLARVAQFNKSVARDAAKKEQKALEKKAKAKAVDDDEEE